MRCKGHLKIDKSANDDMVVTFHDSCNRCSRLAHGSGAGRTVQDPAQRHQGGVQPLRGYGAGNHPCPKTFCCGGGGGLLTDDLMELRVKGAKPRMEALKNVIEEHGVTNMAAICAIL